MDDNDLDFEFDMTAVDRKELLAQAADEINMLRGHLGEAHHGEVTDIPEAATMRALMNDDAKFGTFPLIYKITDSDFIHQQREVPFVFKELARDYNFYWIRLPVQLMPQDNWAYNKLKLHIKLISENVPAHEQPKAYMILPNKQFETKLEMSSKLEVSIDPNFQFSAKVLPQHADIGVAQASIGGGVDARIEAGTGLVVGPFVYHAKKAKINHNATGMEEVKWVIDGAEFFQDYDLQMVVVAQLPKSVGQLRLLAQMQAYRYFTFAPARLQQLVKQLSQKIVDFFAADAPIEVQGNWDLTPRL